MDSKDKNIQDLFDNFYISGDPSELAEALGDTDELKEEPFYKNLRERAEKTIIDKMGNFARLDVLWSHGKIEEAKNLLECGDELIASKTNRSNEIPSLQTNLITACFSPLLNRPDELKECLKEEIIKAKLVMPNEGEATEKRTRFYISNFDKLMLIIARCKHKESRDNQDDYAIKTLFSDFE